MKSITFVEGDDWRGIYIDGELYREGHSHSASDIVEALFDAADGVEEEELFSVVYADLQWLYDEGSLPQKLEDVKVEE